MNTVITIGREFGSGGRELGKRLAETLGIAYYDEEIIAAIAQRSSLAEDYVNQVVEHNILSYYPITVAASFVSAPEDTTYAINRSIYSSQVEILESMAQKSDCVIVGRCADHILSGFRPFRIFVYSDLPSKLARCRKKGGEEAALTDKELEKKIRAVDKARAKYYRFYTGEEPTNRLCYDLGVNTSGMEIGPLAAAIAALVKSRNLSE